MTTNYLPSDTSTVTPHLILKDVAKAIEFYTKVFDAKELFRLPTPNGKIVHACIQIGDSRIMFADEMPQHGGNHVSPETLKGTHATMHMYVPNVDEVFKRAVDAGATGTMPPADMFWGDRYGRIVDPFGQAWSLATHIEDVSPEEMTKRAAECMKEPATAK
jgi:uncharacterized glyoxalase superfamily protein PhnB